MHIGLGLKPFTLVTSVFNYTRDFDGHGDRSARDVSVFISGGLYSPIGGFGPHRSRVAIPPAIIAKWAHVIARIDYPLHFTPRIGGRPIWGWISVSDVALAGRGCSDSVPMVELGGHIFARR